MPRVNAVARASQQRTPLLLDWKREMRTSATETVFPAELTKAAAFRSETARDSEWGKG